MPKPGRASQLDLSNCSGTARELRRVTFQANFHVKWSSTDDSGLEKETIHHQTENVHAVTSEKQQ